MKLVRGEVRVFYARTDSRNEQVRNKVRSSHARAGSFSSRQI